MNTKKIKVALMADAFDRRPERSFFARRLIERLIENPEIDLTLVHFVPMPDEPMYKKAHEILIPRISLPWGSRFASFVYFCLTTKEKFDIFQYLIGRPYPFFWLFPAKKFVVLAHDAGVGIIPGSRTLPNIIFYSTLRFFNRYVDMIIGVSQFARKEIEDIYHVSKEKTAAIYNGIESHYHRTSEEETREALKKYNINAQKYIFYLGGLQPHKNIPRLIDAYGLLRETFPDIKEKLLLAGPPSHRSEETTKAIERSAYKHDIVRVGIVALSDLSALYSGASVFAFPSLHEGFGMPPVEAMACGTPTVVANATSLPEVTGDAAVLVDPLNVKDIMAGIYRVITDKELREQLIEKGYKQAKKFNWDDYAKEHIALYKRLLILR
jgi:glycosyltransferase involved in cell wall biosynthesis